MKSLLLLWNHLAEESARWVGASAARDCKTVALRSKHEGLSFLTITLPTFGKDLEKGLDQGYVDSNLFTGFAWKGGLPRFLSGFLRHVFDRDSGVLLDAPCKTSIRAIRQLTLMFAKIDLPCSDAREIAAYEGYIQCEKEMKVLDSGWDSSKLEEFHQMSQLLFCSFFAQVDRKVYEGNFVTKHGPGSTADGLRGNAKYTLRSWPRRLESYFPSWEVLSYSWQDYQDIDVHLLEPETEMPVEVITVPKTQKTPRIIAMEPTAMQYAQQGILALLREGIEGDYHLRSFLGIESQLPNQQMAHEGSYLMNLATLDLSEASDRVSNQLVKTMFRRVPHLHEAIDSSRSRKAIVPRAGVLRLSKFASMGSALCFPIQAMVFLTIIFLAIQKELRTPLSQRKIRSFVGKVRVFGDDIIVPVEYAPSVATLLEDFGLRVNVHKSFWNGKFRESCGRDYYDGTDVSIVRVRRLFTSQRQNAPEAISMVSLRNQLYLAGYFDTVEWLDGRLSKMLSHFPIVEPSSQVLGRIDPYGITAMRISPEEQHGQPEGWSYSSLSKRRLAPHSPTHVPLVKGYVIKDRSPINAIDGRDALMKWFLSKQGEGLTPPNPDRDHLTRSGRPQSVKLKLGWFRPY